jgi:hypothetical protein
MLQRRHDTTAPIRGEVHTKAPRTLRLFRPARWGGAALVIAVLVGLVVFNVLVFFIALAAVGVIGGGIGLYAWRHRWARRLRRAGTPALDRRDSKELPAS